ncbi:MAG: response regulator transcription factor [Bacteroidota bacterium]
MKKIKVIVVDDHSIFRKGLIMLLEAVDYVEVVGEAADGKEFLEIIKVLDADVVLMDVKMPEMNGIDATKAVLEFKPNLNILALSMFDQEEYVKSMLEVGAKGFLLKNIQGDELEKAITIVNAGGMYYSSELSAMFINNFLGNSKEKKDKASEDIKLTKREVDVLKLVCKEMTNQQIADTLFISERTVHGHRANLLDKIGVTNTVGLVKYAIRKGLIDINDDSK